MKKFVLMVLLMSTLVCSIAVFADAVATEYIVQSVTGKVEFEAAPGKWEVVTGNMKLQPTVVVNTGLNSTLVVKLGDRVVTIKALQKGAVSKLASEVASSKSGVKIGAKATASDVTAESGQSRANISTASTRASDATNDVVWEE